MRAGELPDGAAVLRAKISMASPNLNLRDPIIYRIKHVSHPRAGDAWCIYPTYDFAHGQSDAIEGITHSLCTLEFEDHRPLYEWFLKKLPVPSKPKQTEFSRLELEGTVTSKRKLNTLVTEGYVQGWDDPRMPTIAGLRRRGYSPEGIRLFCERIGVTRKPNTIEYQILEGAVRDDLEGRAQKGLAVLDRSGLWWTTGLRARLRWRFPGTQSTLSMGRESPILDPNSGLIGLILKRIHQKDFSD